MGGYRLIFKGGGGRRDDNISWISICMLECMQKRENMQKQRLQKIPWEKTGSSALGFGNNIIYKYGTETILLITESITN